MQPQLVLLVGKALMGPWLASPSSVRNSAGWWCAERHAGRATQGQVQRFGVRLADVVVVHQWDGEGRGGRAGRET